MKLVAAVGINDYPDTGGAADLAGCVPDARALIVELERWGYEPVAMLLDQVAIRDRILGEFEAFCARIPPRKAGWWKNSSHGTKVPDPDRDEWDAFDEATCAYDGNITDDEYRAIAQRALHSEATLIFDSDSCHSGTLMRSHWQREAEILALAGAPRPVEPRPRYLAPGDPDVAVRAASSIVAESARRLRWRHLPNVALLAACRSDQYAYDAYFPGVGPHGAFTFSELGVLRAARERGEPLTLVDLMSRIGRLLPSPRYPQDPRLECVRSLRKLQV